MCRARSRAGRLSGGQRRAQPQRPRPSRRARESSAEFAELATPVHDVRRAERRGARPNQNAAGRRIEVVDVLDDHRLPDGTQQRCTHSLPPSFPSMPRQTPDWYHVFNRSADLSDRPGAPCLTPDGRMRDRPAMRSRLIVISALLAALVAAASAGARAQRRRGSWRRRKSRWSSSGRPRPSDFR